ncbi:hypothetical protein THRCLA_23287 [Thraustotheca clavata]|uniref:Uncharacterized protein n=1 Tax=Thraustotheca clavata TaxID=74557 RepID=A0A1V9Y818_9STRA|nr:hypothetical protein THRCLA_23287 [Thraustotheca clavata]
MLTELEWDALKYILENDGSLTASTVEKYCNVPVKGEQERRLVDRLLQLGIVIENNDNTLAIVSKLICRI